jgi:hypothetical protein
MSGDEWHDGRVATVNDVRGNGGHEHQQRARLFVYCVVSGLTGTAVAAGLSFAASGIARIAVWVAAVGLVSVLAGLAYDSGPVNALRSAGRPQRQPPTRWPQRRRQPAPQHGDVRARSSVR